MSNLGEHLESAIGNMTGSMSEVVKVVSQSRQLKVEETKAEPIPEAPLSDAKQIHMAAMEAIEITKGYPTMKSRKLASSSQRTRT